MVDTHDPTWDDSGFDDAEDGFMREIPPEEASEVPRAEHPIASDATPLVTQAEPAAAPAPVAAAPVRRIEPLPPPPPQEEEKSRKGGMILIGIAAGLVFLFAVLGGGYYFLMAPSIEDQAFRAPEEQPAVTVDHGATATEQIVVEDTMVAVSEANPVVAEEAASPTPAPEPPVKRAPTAVIAKEVPQKPVTVAEAETIKPVKEESTPKMQPKMQQPSTSPAPAGSAAYVVQVFSSPSRDDADEWLQQLRERNISDGYIVEQNIRGQSWYRVRFGQFTSRESAEAAAINHGFRQPWIARIR